jgi:hypothetical protein
MHGQGRARGRSTQPRRPVCACGDGMRACMRASVEFTLSLRRHLSHRRPAHWAPVPIRFSELQCPLHKDTYSLNTHNTHNTHLTRALHPPHTCTRSTLLSPSPVPPTPCHHAHAHLHAHVGMRMHAQGALHDLLPLHRPRPIPYCYLLLVTRLWTGPSPTVSPARKRAKKSSPMRARCI